MITDYSNRLKTAIEQNKKQVKELLDNKNWRIVKMQTHHIFKTKTQIKNNAVTLN